MFKAELKVVHMELNEFITASDDGHNNGYTDIGDLMRSIDEEIVG